MPNKKTMRRLLLSLLLLSPVLLRAQTQPQDFKTLFKEWKQLPELRSASFALAAAYADSAETVYLYQADRSLIPASTLKVLTTFTGLEVLGADFRFPTILQHTGYLDSTGVLHGDLFVKGGGDPSLGYPDPTTVYSVWYEVLKKLGVKKVQGRIIADARFFDPQLNPGTWTWEDLGNYYGAGVSGLNIDRNEYKIYFKSGATGTPTTFLRTDPPLPEMTFVNELLSGERGSGDNAFIYGSPYTKFRYIRGTITPNRTSFRVRGSLADPTFVVAEGLTRFIEAQGVPVSGAPTTYRRLQLEGAELPSDKLKKDLHVFRSPPLSELVIETNRRSLNLYAEAIFKRIGHQLNAGDSRREAAAEAIRNWWAERGMDTEGLFLEDGSGLSRYTVLTARQQLQVLLEAYKSDYFDVMLASMPVAGRSGSIRSFGRGTRVAGNLRAKSGYLRRVKGYTGYVKSRSGRMVAFSILVNHFGGKNSLMNQRIEKIMTLLAELP
mgnify:CR=1 FL=1